MTRLVLVLLASLALLVLAGCGGDEEADAPATPQPTGTEPGEVEPPEPTEPVETEPAETEPGEGDTTSCTNEEAGFRVDYPADWYTNDETGPVQPCTFFDSEPFEVPVATEFFGAAVAVSRQPVAAEEILEGVDPTREVLEREETEVAGQRAFRMEAESTGDGLLDAGVRYYQVVVAVNGESLILATYDLDEQDYERNREVVDEMADSLELLR
jgi:hypothetical protein